MSTLVDRKTNEGRRNFLKASLGLALTSSGVSPSCLPWRRSVGDTQCLRRNRR